MAKALEGVKVLDFTQYLSGPHGTSVLSELGAEVIKIEMPGKGEPERPAMPKTPKREAYQFLSYNRGKKSITLNSGSPRYRSQGRATTSTGRGFGTVTR